MTLGITLIHIFHTMVAFLCSRWTVLQFLPLRTSEVPSPLQSLLTISVHPFCSFQELTVEELTYSFPPLTYLGIRNTQLLRCIKSKCCKGVWPLKCLILSSKSLQFFKPVSVLDLDRDLSLDLSLDLDRGCFEKDYGVWVVPSEGSLCLGDPRSNLPSTSVVVKS